MELAARPAGLGNPAPARPGVREWTIISVSIRPARHGTPALAAARPCWPRSTSAPTTAGCWCPAPGRGLPHHRCLLAHRAPGRGAGGDRLALARGHGPHHRGAQGLRRQDAPARRHPCPQRRHRGLPAGRQLRRFPRPGPAPRPGSRSRSSPAPRRRARLRRLRAPAGAAARRALVFDIGGGSTEVGWLRDRAERRRRSLAGWHSVPVGVVGLAERHGHGRDLARDLRGHGGGVRGLLLPFEERHERPRPRARARSRCSARSGTVTTLCGVHLELPRYDRAPVDGAYLDFADIERLSARLAAMSLDERAAIPCIGRERADLVVAGCAILAAICRLWPVGRAAGRRPGRARGHLFGLLRRGPRPALTAGAAGVGAGGRDASAAGRRPDRGRRLPRSRVQAPAQHGAAALLDPLARAPAQRPLCRRGPAPGLSLARRLQADAARRPLPSPGAGQEGDRSGRRAGRLDPGRGGALSPSGARQGRVVGIDLSSVEAIAGATLLTAIFSTPAAPARLTRPSAARPMSCFPTWRRPPPATARPIICGSSRWPRPPMRSRARCWPPAAAFVVKVLQGGADRRAAEGASSATSPTCATSSRRRAAPKSAEIYVVALGFRARAAGTRPRRSAAPKSGCRPWLRSVLCMMARHYPRT